MPRRGPIQRFYRSIPILHRTVRSAKDGLVYGLARAALWLVGRLSLARVLPLADLAGALIYRILRTPRKLALAHLGQAFGARLSAAQRDAIARAAFQNFARSFCEVAKFDDILLRADGYVTVEGWEHLADVVAANQSGIAVTGHIGNWELLAAYTARHGIPVTAIAKRIHNRGINDLVVEFRARHGVATILRESSSSGREILRALHKPGFLAMLMDQDVKRIPSVSVPFFGRPARTPAAAARLALKRNIAVVPLFSERRPDGGHCLRILPALEHPNTGDTDRDVVELTRMINQALETQITRHPEQWVWWHRRWRRKPIPRLDLDSELP